MRVFFRRMKKIFVLPILVLSPYLTIAHAAGFNCEINTLNKTEKTICQTPYLSGLDNIANKLFINAADNTLSKGTIMSGQAIWIKERNSCNTDIECIKEKYLFRNSYLISIENFLPISKVFPSSLVDEPLDNGLKNKNGYVIRDKPWLIKQLVNIKQKQDSLNLTNGYWNVLTHLVIDNNLGVIFSVETKRITYLVYISDLNSVSYIIDAYDSESHNAPTITLINRDDSGFSYKVSYPINEDGKSKVPEYKRVNIANGEITSPQTVSQTPVVSEDKQWTGYCGYNSCESELTSPDDQWRVASGDDDIAYRNDGVFLFPKDRPDQGVNVFMSSADNAKDDWSFSRNYSWGNKNSFFFDNDGGLACIWKTDILQKTTERILPVEGLQQPYFLRYDNNDYVISHYIPTDSNHNYLAGFYISRSE